MGLIFNRHKKKEVLEDENSIKEGRQDLKDKKEELRKRLHLFSIDAGLEDDLNKNTVSEGLKEWFKTGGFPLSKDTDISEKGDDKWRITDKREEKSYIVWKEDGKLNIYRGTKISQEKSSDEDKFAGFLAYELTDDNIKDHLEIIRRKTKCPANLCIFASKAKIYVYVTVAKYKNVFDSLAIKFPSHNAFSSEMCINMMKCLGSVPINNPDKLKKDWEGCIRDSNENIIKDYGEDLWNELIPKDIKKTLKAELESDNDKIKDVWIFCEDKNIDFLWEWIYWKEKNFFWGDKFCIVRKPKDRIPENYEAEDPNFKIDDVNILLDENSPPACSDRNCLRDLRIARREIKLNDPNAQNNLKSSDCIHIAADIGQFIHARSLLNALQLSKNIKFLFLNIWGPEISRGLQIMQLINSISAKTWIYTILNVPPDFAPIFAKCFYECVAKEKNVAEAVRKTREEIGEGYLFCITDGKSKNDLNKNIIPKKLKKKFNDENRPLSNTGTITITKENDKWTITDEEKRNIYIAREKDGKLKIYEKERNSGCKKFWRLAYVVKSNP